MVDSKMDNKVRVIKIKINTTTKLTEFVLLYPEKNKEKEPLERLRI